MLPENRQKKYLSDKVDFKLTLVKWDKEGHFILIKGAIHQNKIIIINLCAPNISSPNCIKHTLQNLNAHIDSNTRVVVDFNTPLSPIDRSSKQKTNKEILKLNHAIDQMDLACLQNISFNFCTIYIHLSSPWNLFQNWSYFRAQSKPQQI
jgi:hypothetical protein